MRKHDLTVRNAFDSEVFERVPEATTTDAFLNGERGDVRVAVEASKREDAIAILKDAGFEVA